MRFVYSTTLIPKDLAIKVLHPEIGHFCTLNEKRLIPGALLSSKELRSTREAYLRYSYGSSVSVGKIISACEDIQYRREKVHSFFIQ